MDIDEGRLGRAAPRLSKAGVDNVERHVIEPTADKWLKRRKRSFDRVLVDAPCSGVGVRPTAACVGEGLGERAGVRERTGMVRMALLVRPSSAAVVASNSRVTASSAADELVASDA